MFVVDDHTFFRSGVLAWLNKQPNVKCCGEADSIVAARKGLPEANPDVLLLDLKLKDGDSLAFCAEIAEQFPQLRILILSQADEEVFAHRMLQAGARGYVMKSEATETVLQAIETVLRGDVYLSRVVSARLLQNLFPDPASNSPDLARLSNRELQVFQMLGTGSRSSEIAAALNISPKTVDTYREKLKEKLGCTTSAALVRAAKTWVETGRFASC